MFKDDEGLVRITPHALHELVRKTCEDMEGIFNPTTTIKKKSSGIRLDVQLRIQTDCNVQETRLELKKRLEDVMIKKVFHVSPITTIEEATRLMNEHKIGCLPVVSNNHLVGIVSKKDLGIEEYG